ncbi:3-[(3aS 4S 7aS)-7a-methyl-1 5-dioxo-octahydro-1H-inden-4-yl]propanoyl:CoA ligase [Biomphalaria glabrata]|nr:3-3aS; 4S; 7aS-7a-methyl-1; 5-dioxo-octahydro-1H-inden-4-yl ligase-like [Biomphalaria glabrata]
MGGIVSSMNDLDTLPKRLQYLSEEDPNKELYVFYNRGVRDAYTSRELFTLAGRFAHRLRQQGFQKGDVIANTLPNSPERLITDVGIVMAGCVAMNGQAVLADGSDFFQSAKVSRCGAVIMADEGSGWQLLHKFLKNEKNDEMSSPLSVKEAPELKWAIIISRRNQNLLQDLKTKSQEMFVCPLDTEDVVVVLTTSGSTGYSKLVPRTHREIIVVSVCRSAMISPDVEWAESREKQFLFYSDRMMGWAADHSFYTLCQAETRVMLDLFSKPPGRDIYVEMWEALEAERCKMCTLLLPELEHLMESPRMPSGPKNKLKLIITGAQPYRKSQLKKFFNFSDNVYVVYGSTEVCYMSGKYAKEESYTSNNCGHAVNGMILKVCRDNGEQCQANETGTIFAKGQYVFRGYFNLLEKPTQDSDAFTPGGWFNTEDYGFFNDEGDLHVFGRLKDVIMYGPTVFYPGWMEKRLAENPDIVDAFIVPVTDPVLYQNICAYVRVKKDSHLSQDELRDYCDAIFLSEASPGLITKPKYFIITKEDFPTTLTGKTDKQFLKRKAEELFGCGAKL